MRILSTFILLLVVIDGSAQADTVAVRAKKTTIGFQIDYGKIAYSLAADETRYEGALDLIIADKFQIIGEYGTLEASPDDAFTNGDYTVSGSYWRAGIGYVPFNNGGRLGLGVRYAPIQIFRRCLTINR